MKTTPFDNDPSAIVWQAFENLYPGKKCHCTLYPNLSGDDESNAYGLTNFCEDGEIFVYVDPTVGFENIPEILAHELAHVAVGIAAEHGPAWEKAFDALNKEYFRLCDEEFGPEEVSP